jgi:hypothetical protein
MLRAKKTLQLSERFRTLCRGIGMLRRLGMFLETLEAFPEIPDGAGLDKVE